MKNAVCSLFLGCSVILFGLFNSFFPSCALFYMFSPSLLFPKRCAYGYYTKDPFVLTSNLPGLVLSLWLNTGAAKLQYLERWEGRHKRDREGVVDILNDEASDLHVLVTVSQERLLFRILIAWCVVIVYVGWFNPFLSPRSIIGAVVNLNLVLRSATFSNPNGSATEML
jgi:hypothetical protein